MGQIFSAELGGSSAELAEALRADIAASPQKRPSLNRLSSRERRDSSGADTLSFLKEAINKEVSTPPQLKKTEDGVDRSEPDLLESATSFSLRRQMPEPLLRSLSELKVKEKADAASMQTQEKERLELAALRSPRKPAAPPPVPVPEPPKPSPPKGFMGGLVRKISGSISGARPKSASKAGDAETSQQTDVDDEDRKSVV